MTNKVKPNSGQDVFIAQINTLAGIEEKRYFIHQYWCDSGHQNQLLELGILFTDKDDAIAKTKSLLGISGSSPKQVEWKNGDEIEYGNDISMSPCWTGRYVCFDNAKGKHIIENDNGLWHISESCIRKPETPEQKAERERV